jgi:hypothetical protein
MKWTQKHKTKKKKKKTKNKKLKNSQNEPNIILAKFQGLVLFDAVYRVCTHT